MEAVYCDAQFTADNLVVKLLTDRDAKFVDSESSVSNVQEIYRMFLGVCLKVLELC